ncbi:glycoside hydrolase family 16 protein [Podospora appendiculata]|uniref:endo-1,3(4)-beta-glucanase n=1 Tax=Podospora appendiculata TaxID=314037 RepID=A0AAE1CHR8_9PEZI|nr:glycoside hydrolase family 16 protein [Podospora appendiculata]
MFLPSTLLGAAALTASLAQAASNYALVDVYDQNNFFKEFDFFTEADPTDGFVKYLDSSAADHRSLAGYIDDAVFLGVDDVNKTQSGRASVRVTSKKAYTTGLFIADIAHMPAGRTDSQSCGLWPAFWMVGPNWPNSGEIDILEGVNTQSSNAITLHTGPGCNITNTGSVATTELMSSDCQGNQGCSQNTQSQNNYGAGFNAAGGGVYVVEWTDQSISSWFFSRNSTMATSLASAASNTTAAPDTSSFGLPLANFVGGSSCDISQHFQNQQIVINTDFCGQWAGQVWDQDSTCSALASSCDTYVGANPEAFSEAYWLINSIKIYQQSASSKRAERQGLPFSA